MWIETPKGELINLDLISHIWQRGDDVCLERGDDIIIVSFNGRVVDAANYIDMITEAVTPDCKPVELPEMLSEAQINSACLLMRHDFADMDELPKKNLRRDCIDWYYVVRKELTK